MRLCNFSVANVTESANYFHILRRQVLRKFRKPLVLLFPKKALMNKLSKSSMKDFTEVGKFRSVLPDGFAKDINEPSKIRKIFVCSGQVYFDLIERRS